MAVINFKPKETLLRNHSAMIKLSGVNYRHYWDRVRYFKKNSVKHLDWFSYFIAQEIWSGCLSANEEAIKLVRTKFEEEYKRAIADIQHHTRHW